MNIKKTPTLGFLVHDLVGAYQSAMWSGVAEAALTNGVSLVCFSGGELQSPYGFNAQRNRIYDLAGGDCLDGLLILAGALGNYVGRPELLGFCERYRPLPVVSLAMEHPRLPAVVVDDEHGLRQVLEHLVKVHGCRRIAFLRGPRGNPEADRRYGVYEEVLRRHGLPLDMTLVGEGNFRQDQGRQAVEAMLDRPGVVFDALAAANDDMALGALQALQARGRRVPDEVALVGFDDIEDAQLADPPLTTVRQPVYAQSRRGVEVILALMRGETVPPITALPTEMVARRSCGCRPVTTAGTGTSETLPTPAPFADTFAARRPAVVAALTPVIGAAAAEQLVEAFAAAAQSGDGRVFLETVDAGVRQTARSGGEPFAWQRAMAVLRRMVGPGVSSQDIGRELTGNMWQEACLLIGAAAVEEQSRRRLLLEQQMRRLHLINEALMAVTDWSELRRVLAEHLAHLGIPAAYLSVYERPAASLPAAGNARLVVAWADSQLPALPPAGLSFPARFLVPRELWPPPRQYACVVQALFFRNELLGFVVFEQGFCSGLVYEILREQLNGTLHRLLVAEAARR